MTDSVPEKLGKYKIIEEVGRGGFAAVYKAVDTTLDRTVALKVLAPHLLWGPTFVQRFQREAKVAANLDHPNIVTIHEVSQVEGVYFIAMQFLEGRTVSHILEAEGPLPVSRVQAIIEQLASAPDYAHARGFVHRDVKPSNVIVAYDGRATLTDFGLVKAGEGTKLSTTGVVFGTPEYMSPEQAEGKKLDAQSDVYSLGVVLFEMLAGRAPFMADTTPAVMYKHVHEPPPLDELPSDLPQGVVAVVEKALAKDPADRYQSTGEMVDALRKAVAEAEVVPPPLVEPVAVPEEEAVPFWRKVPLWGWGAIGGVILLAVVGGILLAGRSLRATPMVAAISPDNAAQVVQLTRWGKGTVEEVTWSPDGHLLALASSVGIYLYDAETLEEVRYIETEDQASSVAFSLDGKTLASGSVDDTVVRLWGVEDGALLRTLNGHTSGVRSVAFSPDEETLASGSYEGTVRLWRISDGSLLHTLEGHTDSVNSVAFSPDGVTLASGSEDNTVRLWRVSNGSLLRTPTGHTDYVNSVDFSPDGETLASGSEDNTVRLWRVSDGRLLHTLEEHTSSVYSVAFSPDGETLASGSWQEIRLWRVSDGSLLRILEGHTHVVDSVAFSPDGATLASGAGDGTVRLWGVATD